jgi:hypothetical protein
MDATVHAAPAPVPTAPHHPLGIVSHWVGRIVTAVTPFVVGLLTLLLTLYLAFQSSELHEADTALRAYSDWVQQHPREKLYAAFKLYRYEQVLNVTAPPLTQLDAYEKLVEDAQQLANQGIAIQNLLQDAATLQYVPRFLENAGPQWARRIAQRLNGRSWSVEVLPEVPVKQLLAAPTSAATSPCKDESTGAVKVAVGPQLPPQMAQSYEKSWACFLRRLQMDEHTLNYSPWPGIYDTQYKINLLVTWLLPGLYGLLGACVYLMRGIVLQRERMVHEKSVLNALSLLLRIALGGLAGIIIGWFWVPAPGATTALPQISSLPFGIAFLAGFSIETLFSLLDRLNNTIANTPTAKP